MARGGRSAAFILSWRRGEEEAGQTQSSGAESAGRDPMVLWLSEGAHLLLNHPVYLATGCGSGHVGLATCSGGLAGDAPGRLESTGGAFGPSLARWDLGVRLWWRVAS